MDFYKIPIGFGLALSANTAAMNRYAHLSESQKQDILNKAQNVRSSLKKKPPEGGFCKYYRSILCCLANSLLSSMVFRIFLRISAIKSGQVVVSTKGLPPSASWRARFSRVRLL